MTRKKQSKRSKEAKAIDKELSQPHAKTFTFFFKEKETAVSMLKEINSGIFLSYS